MDSLNLPVTDTFEVSLILWNKFPESIPVISSWYLVHIQEVTDLGLSSYLDLISWGHSANEGNHWNVKQGGRVIAWSAVSKPNFKPKQ